MNIPTTYEEACALAMWAHGSNCSLAEVRAAGEKVATFMEQFNITEAQDYELSALISGLLGIQLRHPDHPLNNRTPEERAKDRARQRNLPTRFEY
ncbi:hypothetical protein [Deinococcus sp.]|uniref:hypothetical protein n=1 Tax=Deinococcus sp. TaxID=47478 RepID=UPI003C7BE5EB